MFVNGKCILEETGIHHRNAIYPLISIISKWKGYRENLADEEDFLVIKYPHKPATTNTTIRPIICAIVIFLPPIRKYNTK